MGPNKENLPYVRNGHVDGEHIQTDQIIINTNNSYKDIFIFPHEKLEHLTPNIDDIFYDCAIAQSENSDLNKLFEKVNI